MTKVLSRTGPIHPPIQGGNDNSLPYLSILLDTPSHTGRKQQKQSQNGKMMTIHPPIQGGNRDSLLNLRLFTRYTLPYREETRKLLLSFNCSSDTPSHTGRKHSVFMRVSATSNTSLCNLHKAEIYG